MSEFILRPTKLSGCRFVPTEGAALLSLSLKEMFARFAPSGAKVAKEKIVQLRPGAYFGLLSDASETLRNFTIWIPSRDNKVDWLLRKNPTFAKSLVELYLVERAHLDARFLQETSQETH